MIVNGFEVDGEIGLVQLLDLAMREVQRTFGAAPRHAPPGELRGSQYRVLSMVPRDGSRRLSDLATIAGMTRQALGEFVADLAARGYVEIGPDPDDGRARLVVLTDTGREAADRARRLVAEVQDVWEERLGPAELAELNRLLARVADVR